MLLRPLLEARREVSGSRADLLQARHGVVPFLGRAELLAHLMKWREDPEPLRVAVLAGEGGYGKTRMAVEMCVTAERAGWTVGFLGLTDDRQLSQVTALAEWPGRLLAAVDYAETRPGVVAELLAALCRRPGARGRWPMREPASTVLVLPGCCTTCRSISPPGAAMARPSTRARRRSASVVS
jgi:hypothetical protein